MRLISPEEITKAVNKVYPSGTEAYSVNVADKAIAQAQLDEDRKELREIFEKLEDFANYLWNTSNENVQSLTVVKKTAGRIEALKQKYLGD